MVIRIPWWVVGSLASSALLESSLLMLFHPAWFIGVVVNLPVVIIAAQKVAVEDERKKREAK